MIGERTRQMRIQMSNDSLEKVSSAQIVSLLNTPAFLLVVILYQLPEILYDDFSNNFFQWKGGGRSRHNTARFINQVLGVKNTKKKEDFQFSKSAYFTMNKHAF